MALLNLLLGLGVLTLACYGVARLTRRPSWDSDEPGRASSVAAKVAVVVAVVAAPWAWFLGSAFVPAGLGFIAIGLAVVLTTGFVTELWPRPTGPVRTASLGTERAGTDRLVARTRVMVATGILAGLLCLVGAVTAGPGGTTFVREYDGFRGADGPYPGPPVALLLGAGLVALAAATWWAIRRVAAVPAGPDPAADEYVRIRTLVRILRGATFGFAGSFAVTAFPMTGKINQATQRMRVQAGTAGVDYPLPPWDFVQDAAFALSVVGAILLLIALGNLASGRPYLGLRATQGDQAGSNAAAEATP